MKRLIFIAIVSLLITPLLGSFGWGTAQADDDATFSNRDIEGPYGFSFDGFVLDPTLGLVPAGATGQLDADGAGTFPRLVRTLNLGGAAGTQLFEDGVYTVNPDGTGFACFCGSAPQAIPGVPPLPFSFPTFETFSFVITGEDRDEADFAGVSLRFIVGICPLDLGISCPPGASKDEQDLLQKQLLPADLSLSVVTGVARTQSSGDDDND